MKTLVIGASIKPERYSNMAIRALRKHNHEVFALGKKVGVVADVTIKTEFPANDNIHTVTLYLGAKHQPEYYKSLLELKPERVIFNPGAENFELAELLEMNGIETIEGCTLVMLGTSQF
ncbi:CoA-binding protein [Draconibacterium sp.]|jgi:predicted CoA-binding protein